jgi:hypothetical protein
MTTVERPILTIELVVELFLLLLLLLLLLAVRLSLEINKTVHVDLLLKMSFSIRRRA